MAKLERRERHSFANIPSTVPIPNLIEIQKESYDRFLQLNLSPGERLDTGLQSVFKGVFPISDYRESCSLEYVSYDIGDSKYSIEECIERNITYAAPLKVTIRLVVWDVDEEAETRTIRDIKEQEVYFGDIPLMTISGTFIINGTERVIVSQLHRSPGVFFHWSKQKEMHYAQIIPYRGSWVEFEIDKKDMLAVRIDRKRKIAATVLLKALGMSSPEEIIDRFIGSAILKRGDAETLSLSVGTQIIGLKIAKDVNDGKRNILTAGKKITQRTVTRMTNAGIENVFVARTDLSAVVAAADIFDEETGEVIVETNEELMPKLDEVFGAGIEEIKVTLPDTNRLADIMNVTLKKDNVSSQEEALMEIYRRLRPGDPPTVDSAKKLFDTIFFNPQAYDLSRVGRLKFNSKLNIKGTLDEKTLTPENFMSVVDYLLQLRVGNGQIDDIDHLGNRRVRCVGELMENQFRIGLVRMERAIKEKMSVYPEIATAMPHDLVNAKPVLSAVREFFGSSQLSQFMDQTNPLSEITHKRRLSALGPGGLSRERAGFEVRDVHTSHYGRICPIETPEGPNIGLISSLGCYARVNEFGFIESPYRRVEDGKIVDLLRITKTAESTFELNDIVPREELDVELARLKKAKKPLPDFVPHADYLSAYEEDRHFIAQANATLDEDSRLVNDRVNARKSGEPLLAAREDVTYIDVSPKQLVSAAASMIPFLEHDDANRALMGSNMQRQAVPLLRSQAPYVGTGMEATTARDSNAVALCKRDGVVEYVDGNRIVVSPDSPEEGERSDVDVYKMTKFRRSNQNTCINQRPIIESGQHVKKDDVLADGPCTDNGELALGRNVMVAFMPWRGYNFEDAILVSEKLVREDLFTSIHIEEFEVEARDTKLGPEEITRDIPNISDDLLKNLDDSGIIRIGARVTPGDILVGKVTPKGETQLTPEEKLLRAIFGEKAGDVRDASLYVPPGIDGVAVGVRIFSRKGIEKDNRTLEIESDELDRIEREIHEEIQVLNASRVERIAELVNGQALLSDIVSDETGDTLLKAGTKLSLDNLEAITGVEARDVVVEGDAQIKVDAINDSIDEQIDTISKKLEEKLNQFNAGDELPPGVRKSVKVYIAMKRKLQVGDKMAGRHGNKGVISRIMAEENMPYLPDGTPVEIVLNPLGVPSRMNVGQILETTLGWAGLKLGVNYACPVFDGPSEEDIQAELEKAGLPLDGKTVLHDGLTGEPFDERVTVGEIYMLKLFHMVDDKIHARSIGPYSLITQQPLGGKAQFGGQRFGEMEVWALEAYGAAHTLQELLTAKSDDVFGRSKIYEAIVKGQTTLEPGVPESFNVLVRELQSLCLDVQLISEPKSKLDELIEQAGAAVEDSETVSKDPEKI
jgi:DNA-directed RNA polymerase subunit beta